MKKIKLLFLLAVILFTLFILILLILNIFLPKKIESFSQDIIKAYWNKNLEVKSIKLTWNGRINFKDIIIYEDKKTKPYLKIQSLAILPFYPSLLSKKLFIIYYVVINAPYYAIKRDEKGDFNFPPLKFESKSKEKNIVIKKISIKDLSLDFEDKKMDFKKKFKHINVFLDMTLLSKIKFHLESFTEARPDIVLNGIFSLATKRLKANINIKDVALFPFRNYFQNIGNLNSAFLKKANLILEGETSYKLKGRALIENIDITNKKFKFKGNLDIRPLAVFNIENKEILYSIEGKVVEGRLKDIPYLEELSKIKGLFILKNNEFELTSFEAELKGNILNAQLMLANFKDPYVNLKAQYKGSLEDLKDLIRVFKKVNINFALEGAAFVNLDLKGKLKNKKYDYSIVFFVKDGYIKNLKELQNINFQGTIVEDSIKIEKLNLTYKNIPVEAELEFKDFNLPQLELILNSALFDADLKATYENKKWAVKSLEIYKNSSRLSAKGYFSNLEPWIKLQGLGSCYFNDVLEVLEKLKIIETSRIKKLNPQGPINLNFIGESNPETKSWHLKLAGFSDNFKIYKANLKNLKVELYGDNKLLIINPLEADLWNGKAELKLQLDYPQDKLTLNIIGENIDLSQMKQELELKEKLSGTLFLEASLENNNPKEVKDARGQGKIFIKDGNIWEISFLRGLGEFLFIPEFDKIIFEECYAEFLLKENNTFFDQVELNSLQMELNGQGRISFEGEVNFLLSPTFNPALIEASEGLKKITTNFLGKTGLVIEVEGNIKDPRYRLKPTFLSPLDKFKSLFEEILR